MTLAEQVEHFLYNYSIQHHKQELLYLIRKAEEAYLSRIRKLENELHFEKHGHLGEGYDYGSD